MFHFTVRFYDSTLRPKNLAQKSAENHWQDFQTFSKYFMMQKSSKNVISIKNYDMKHWYVCAAYSADTPRPHPYTFSKAFREI